MKDHLLALDLGSSGLKAVLFDRAGGVAAQAEAGYPTRAASDGGQEQDPADWWQATIAASGLLPAALRDRTAAVVLVGTMENLVALDAAGLPVRPALLYSDPRGAAAFERLRPALEAAGAPALLGNTLDPLATAFKAAWLDEAEPEAAARATLLLPGAKDALALRLTGAATTDPVTATTSGLMDLARRDWSPALCRICGIAVGRLPPIRAAGAILGSTTQEVSAALGLPAATPVVNGCGDAGASLVGAGDEGGAHIYLGTSGWIARSRPLDASVLPRPFYTLAHPEDGLAIEVAPILTAGDAAAWFGRIAGAGIALLDAQASARDAAPPDLMFLPYLKGERSPFVDLALRGAFIGLDAAHDRADLHLAVLEGVALALAGVLEAMGGAAGPLRLTGGGARSRVWPQLIADACGETVECLDLPAATTAFGGFRIAAAALGWPPARAVVGARFAPRPERAERVRRRLALFRAATASLRALAVA